MLKFVPGYTPDEPAKRARAKSSRLLLGTSPSYPRYVDNRFLEKLQLDQGHTGSCGGHGTSQRLQVASAKQGVDLGFIASPGDIYKVTRCIERAILSNGTFPPLADSGIMPADLIVAVNQWGVRPMGPLVVDADGQMRNSDVSASNINQEPDLEALERDAQTLLLGQYRVDDQALDSIQQTYAAIASQGAVGIGIFVDSAFQHWSPTDPPLDTVDLSDPKGGGHWTTVVGYDADVGALLIWNSWGNSWGLNGHIWVSTNWFRKAVFDVYADKLQVVKS